MGSSPERRAKRRSPLLAAAVAASALAAVDRRLIGSWREPSACGILLTVHLDKHRSLGMRVSTVGPMVVAVCVLAASVRADQVHLVGGAQLEGKVTRHGDKIVVEMESGQITLSADGVERIERGPSSVQHVEELASKLKPGDVQARLSLADYCRDHDMQAREKALLRQVLELDTNQPQARARLGYVKTASGWITREEQLRAQGFVRHDGQWVTPERALEQERLHAQSDVAAKERDRAQAELEVKKLELQQRKLELDAQAATAAQNAATPLPHGYAYGSAGYVSPYGYGPARGTFNAPRPSAPATRPFPTTRPFPIPGVRDPRDATWSLPGVRDPRSY
jgi:hypothetical protein